jgi:hypothetical protein
MNISFKTLLTKKIHLFFTAGVLSLTTFQAQSFTVEQKAKFDKKHTMQLVTGGKSVIKGQAFARDNESGIKGIAVLNINKKQFAPRGTTVVLIPYTDYYKEWIEVSKKYGKQGKVVQLPKEAKECIRVVQITNDEGNFEFNNLMPGQYLLYSQFGYQHTQHASEVVGRKDYYVNNSYQGSSDILSYFTYGVNASAYVDKVVTIKNDGDVEHIKLKRTL